MVRNLRTAVLVVHGMGSQRPLATVRGVINAIWFDNDDHSVGSKRLWSHPEPSGVDLDLTVMTTNDIPGTQRPADFHELYWAHHMSETKAVAVLLWLFELGRKGPHFKTGMNGLWWCGAVFLCLLFLSGSLLSLKAVTWFAGIAGAPYDILIVMVMMLMVALLASIIAAVWYRYWILSGLLIVLLLGIFGIGWLLSSYGFFAQAFNGDHPILLAWTNAIFAPALAFVAAHLLMKSWGRWAFALTYVLSLGFFVIYLAVVWKSGQNELSTGWTEVWATISSGRWPWGLSSQWSIVAAWTIIGVYLIINAAFLQPYLGDAARYYRNSPANVAVRRAIRKDAVDTLEQLHRSRDYDRIVVVAHSLGTSVAYDMLRAYYSRICGQIPIDKTKLNPEFDAVDGGLLDCASMRAQGRKLIKKFAAASAILTPTARQDPYKPAAADKVDAWLVTDFVTVGSPLTHARYLMVNDDKAERLEQDFWDEVRERALPTCAPQKLDKDGLISFRLSDGSLRLHHGGMFGMTRWTNLFFPIANIFWGDAIGGPVAPVFGGCVEDNPVWPDKARSNKVFTHTWYWKTDCGEKRDAPHIQALRAAINLEDKP